MSVITDSCLEKGHLDPWQGIYALRLTLFTPPLIT